MSVSLVLDDTALGFERLGDDVGAAEGFELMADFYLDGFGEGAGGGEENGRCQNIMFCLSQ